MQTCYVIQHPGIAMKSEYLKPIFKGRRSTVSIWGAIIYEKKDLVHFLAKKGQIILEIYVEQILRPQAILLYKK